MADEIEDAQETAQESIEDASESVSEAEKTIDDAIEDAEHNRRVIAKQLMEQDAKIAELKAQRFECKHDFAPALKGYEHEGGHCKKCGINEVFWEHNKKEVK